MPNAEDTTPVEATRPAEEDGNGEQGLRAALLDDAGRAVTAAVRGAQNNGTALQATAHAVQAVLSLAEQIAIDLRELGDAFRRAQREADIAYVGGEMSKLHDIIEQAGPLLAAGPDEIADRLAAAKAGRPYMDQAPQTVAGTTNQHTLMLPLTADDLRRLESAAGWAGVSVTEFAHAAIMRSVVAAEQGQGGK